MALIKPLNSRIGVEFDAAYWKINKISLSMRDRRCSLEIQPYATKADRVAGADPIVSESICFSICDEEFDATFLAPTPNHVAAAYIYLKATEALIVKERSQSARLLVTGY